MRFIAMARFSCASLQIEPKHIAPVTKRLTISLAGSTSSSGIGGRLLEVEQAANRAAVAAFVVDELGIFLERGIPGDANRLLQLGNGIGIPHVVFAVAPPLVLPAIIENVSASILMGGNAWRCLAMVSWATTSSGIPSSRLDVPVKYFATRAWLNPTASKICAPR